MNILIVSDTPKRCSFAQILSLKEKIQQLGRHNVDLFTFGEERITLNSQRIGDTSGNIFDLLKRLFAKKSYRLIIVSLEKVNLKKLLKADADLSNLKEEIASQATFFVFGASSVLSKFEKLRSKEVHIYFRPGVSKLTAKFKRDVTDFVLSGNPQVKSAKLVDKT